MSTAQTINGYTHALPDATDAEWGGPLASLLDGLSYSKRAFLVFSGASGLSAGVTSYAVPGYAAVSADEPSVPVPFAGVVAIGYARARTAPVGGSVRWNLRVNGSDVTGVAMPEGSTTASVAAAATVAAGDRISVSLVPSGLYASGADDYTVTLSLVPA
jgi:hypothetical protein